MALWLKDTVIDLEDLSSPPPFHSRALRLGRAKSGIELKHRLMGRTHLGGPVERMNRTLMQRLKAPAGSPPAIPLGGPEDLSRVYFSANARIGTA